MTDHPSHLHFYMMFAITFIAEIITILAIIGPDKSDTYFYSTVCHTSTGIKLSDASGFLTIDKELTHDEVVGALRRFTECDEQMHILSFSRL